MTWFKVDDKFWSHPKILACSLEARGLWITAGSYCSEHETDGFVPAQAIHLFGLLTQSPRDTRPQNVRADSAQTPQRLRAESHGHSPNGLGFAAAELVHARLWVEVDGGYLFNHWSDYQPTAEELDKKRAVDRQRKAKVRAAKASKSKVKRPQNVRADSAQTPQRLREDSANLPNVPTRPIYTSREVTNVPSLDGGVGEGNNATAGPEPAKPDGADAPAATAAHQAPKAKPAKRATPLPDDWKPNPTHAQIAADHGIHVTVEAAKFRDWLTATGRTYRDHDAAFRNWLRNAKPGPLPNPTPAIDELAARRQAQRDRDQQARNTQRANATPPTREFLDLKTKLRKANP